MNLAEMRNLGKKSAEMLESSGIHSPEQVKRLGSVATFLAVKNAGLQPSFNLLWALEGAIQEVHWLDLNEDEKNRLRSEVESMMEFRF